MSKLIDKINKDLAKNNLEIRTKESRNWLFNHLRSMRVNRPALLRDKTNTFVRRMIPGKMYFYSYFPKMAETLPYYDLYPIVIPVKKYSDGILGMNLHYLPPKLRVIFLDKLYTILNNEKYDETTKLKLSYNLLEGSQRYKEFKPCLKRYLNSYLASRIVEIPINDWEIVCFLPTEMFVGEKATRVQRESVISILRPNEKSDAGQEGLI